MQQLTTEPSSNVEAGVGIQLLAADRAWLQAADLLLSRGARKTSSISARAAKLSRACCTAELTQLLHFARTRIL